MFALICVPVSAKLSEARTRYFFISAYLNNSKVSLWTRQRQRGRIAKQPACLEQWRKLCLLAFPARRRWSQMQYCTRINNGDRYFIYQRLIQAWILLRNSGQRRFRSPLSVGPIYEHVGPLVAVGMLRKALYFWKPTAEKFNRRNGCDRIGLPNRIVPLRFLLRTTASVNRLKIFFQTKQSHGYYMRRVQKVIVISEGVVLVRFATFFRSCLEGICTLLAISDVNSVVSCKKDYMCFDFLFV